MKIKNLEPHPETTTFGSLGIGTEFVFGTTIFIKTGKGQHLNSSGTFRDFNCLCLNDYDYQFYLMQDIEPVQLVECVLEYKVVR